LSTVQRGIPAAFWIIPDTRKLAAAKAVVEAAEGRETRAAVAAAEARSRLTRSELTRRRRESHLRLAGGPEEARNLSLYPRLPRSAFWLGFS
jgi:hypothetical protein